MGETSAATGALCAVIAAGSILAGKALAVKFVFDKEIAKEMESLYDEFDRMAGRFAQVDADDDNAISQFLVDEEMTYAPNAGEVGTDEIVDFKTDVMPFLKDISAGKVDKSNWLDSEYGVEMMDAINAEFSIIDIVKEGLGAMDIIFGLLGIVTAFKVGSGVGSEA